MVHRYDAHRAHCTASSILLLNIIFSSDPFELPHRNNTMPHPSETFAKAINLVAESDFCLEVAADSIEPSRARRLEVGYLV